jgi:Ca2+-transporting ATPase
MELNDLAITLIALGVSAIPESLPVVLTVILAAGVWRMSNNNALVKDLYAVEALGQATVMALDKTGTITKNEMMVGDVYINDSIYNVTGDGYNPTGDIFLNDNKIRATEDESIMLAARTLALSSVSGVEKDQSGKNWRLIFGDPTEGALVVFARKLGIERDHLEDSYKNLGELPFDLDTKYHASLHEIDNESIISVAGSPEVMLASSSMIYTSEGNIELTNDKKEEIKERIKEYSNKGNRILGFGYKVISKNEITHEDMEELVFLGFVSISDAIRPEAFQAIADAKKAGLHVVMITGDHQDTAKSIAQNVGIYKEGDNIITGKDLFNMEDEELISVLDSTTVFARVSPEQKMKIVELYKKKGDILAMTGDGINDALSLKAAHLGVAMGHIGTDSAKQAADVVLLDDNFATITKAILEGRNVYQTIRKTLTYLLSTNAGEMLTIAVALVIGIPLPLLATQIIWLNLVTDSFLVIGLSLEPKNTDTLTRTRTPKKYTLMYGRDWFRTILTAVTMATVSILFFMFNLRVSLEYALTMSLSLLVIMQWYIIFNVRSEKKSVFYLNNMSWYLIASLILTLILQAIVIYVPFMQEIFHTMAIGVHDWIIIFILGLSVVVVEELRKLFTWIFVR